MYIISQSCFACVCCMRAKVSGCVYVWCEFLSFVCFFFFIRIRFSFRDFCHVVLPWTFIVGSCRNTFSPLTLSRARLCYKWCLHLAYVKKMNEFIFLWAKFVGILFSKKPSTNCWILNMNPFFVCCIWSTKKLIQFSVGIKVFFFQIQLNELSRIIEHMIFISNWY